MNLLIKSSDSCLFGLLVRLLVLVVTLLQQISLAAQIRQPLYLNLEEAVHLALAKNYEVQISRLNTLVKAQQLRADIGVFDPSITSHFNFEQIQTDVGLSQFLDYDNKESFIGITGKLPWGTEYELGFSSNDTSNSSYYEARNSSIGSSRGNVSSSVGITLTQPLLRGLGLAENYAEVNIAKHNMDFSKKAFQVSVVEIITEVTRAYYALYLADQSLEIIDRNRINAARLLQENKRRVEIGVMAPLDIYQAESEVAFRETGVIGAKRAKRTAQIKLISLVSDNPEDVLNFYPEIVPPERPILVEPNVEKDFRFALESRPEYRQILIELEIRDLVIDRDRQRILPELNLVLSADKQGIGRTFNDSFQEIGSSNNMYSIGIVFSMPLFNRSRSAALEASFLERSKAEFKKRILEQQIMAELADTANQVELAWQQAISTRQARELAAQSLEAEEKKLQAGNSETFFVLRLQGDLASAELLEINALYNYRIALIEYNRACGLTLDRLTYSIDLNEDGFYDSMEF